MKKSFTKVRNQLTKGIAKVKATVAIQCDKIMAVMVSFIMGIAVKKAKLALSNERGEGFIDNAISILIGVVVGALLLAGLYMLFEDTVLPTLVKRIQEMFNYAG